MFPKFDAKLNRFSVKCINKDCDIDLFELIKSCDDQGNYEFRHQIHTCTDRPKLNMWTDRNFYFFTYKGWGEKCPWDDREHVGHVFWNKANH